jgi:hypothetical protein
MTNYAQAGHFIVDTSPATRLHAKVEIGESAYVPVDTPDMTRTVWAHRIDHAPPWPDALIELDDVVERWAANHRRVIERFGPVGGQGFFR